MYIHTYECTYVHVHIMFNFHSGVPLVYIVRNTLVPESLSEMSYSEADKVNICMYAKCSIHSFAFCMFHRVLLWLLSLCASTDFSFVAYVEDAVHD